MNCLEISYVLCKHNCKHIYLRGKQNLSDKGQCLEKTFIFVGKLANFLYSRTTYFAEYNKVSTEILRNL